jgi:hypothetical protein
MSAQEKHINSTQFSNEDINLITHLVAVKILALGFVVEKPMTRKQAAAFSSYGLRTFDKMAADGIFKAHRYGEKGDPRYLPSEIIKAITGL